VKAKAIAVFNYFMALLMIFGIFAFGVFVGELIKGALK
jgi:hypothetical protein